MATRKQHNTFPKVNESMIMSFKASNKLQKKTAGNIHFIKFDFNFLAIHTGHIIIDPLTYYI